MTTGVFGCLNLALAGVMAVVWLVWMIVKVRIVQELNEQVALIMGWKKAETKNPLWYIDGNHYLHSYPPNYSSNKQLAWELVEKFGLTVGPYPDGWVAGKQEDAGVWRVRAGAPTIPEAVSRAVVMLDEPTTQREPLP